MNNRSLFLCLIFSVCLSTLFAQNTYYPVENLSDFKTQLQQSSKNTKTIASDFVQERHIEMLTKPLISKGKFWFKKPANVRWEYYEPYSSTIILSRRKVIVKDDENSKEYDTGSSSMFKDLGEVMFRFILGDMDAAEKDYDIDYKENNKYYFVKLTPLKDNNISLGVIELYFDKTDYSLSKLIMFDSENDYTGISFLNKTLNKDIESDVFKMK